jgi:hypothetical protein
VSVRYLIDTDWVIDAFIGTLPSVRLLDRLSDDGLAVSVISLVSSSRVPLASPTHTPAWPSSASF